MRFACWRCKYRYPLDELRLLYDGSRRHECRDRAACDRRRAARDVGARESRRYETWLQQVRDHGP